MAGTSNGNLAVARYHPNGTLDLTLGGSGVVVQDLGGAEAGQAVALDAAGKIVVSPAATAPMPRSHRPSSGRVGPPGMAPPRLLRRGDPGSPARGLGP